MIQDIKNIKNDTIKNVAFLIMNKMLTAPKAKGIDDVKILYIDGEEKLQLIQKMIEHGNKIGRSSFQRDAENIRNAVGVILIGSKKIVLNLDCGMCGAPTCTQSVQENRNCVFPSIDLGIALGSGVSLSSELGVDNRIMYTTGEPARQLNFFQDKNIKIILGVPLNIASKNIFFDRK